MKKAPKVFLIIFIALILTLISAVCINTYLSSKEKHLLCPLGITVPIDNGEMSVYTEGKGDKTLVFLSGGGTCSPILDFKSLYTKLSGKYKIAVVEKFGYGFSDITPRPRDIDLLLSDTRKALRNAGVKGPFILVPHSMSGLEALYWAQNYPGEVEAIIGLDMATPYHYKNMNVSLPFLHTMSVLHKMGISRLIPNIWKGEAVRHGTLTEEEKEIYKALFYAKSLNRNMKDEAKEVMNNAQIVAHRPAPNIPILLIVSNGKGTGIKTDMWHACSKAFSEYETNCEIIEYDVPHYIHNYKYNEISEDIDNFIEIL